jgi:hypothetical protein
MAWFLLFPSLGLVQKYLGTDAAMAYVSVGSLLIIGGASRGMKWLQRDAPIAGRTFRLASSGLLAALALGFLVFYPMANAGVTSWLSPSGIVGGGSDRDEALNRGARALLAGHYPYAETTQLDNLISPMPGTLVLAIPFVTLGNVAWQNVVWFGVFLAGAKRLLGDGRAALTVVTVSLLASPVVWQETVTGGDLITNSLVVLVALLMLHRVADASRPVWTQIAAAVFAGIAISSRSVFLLLVPLLFAALVRRAGLRHALISLSIVGAAFTAVTLPFYWHDPGGFAPLQAQNKFAPFDAAIPGSRWLFPGLSLVFAVMMSCVRGSGTMGAWLIQSGLVLTFPVALFVVLATAQSRWPQLAFTSYALSGLFFGILGLVISCRDSPALLMSPPSPSSTSSST